MIQMPMKKISDKELREYLYGWLWVEENIMKPVREKIGKLEKNERNKR